VHCVLDDGGMHELGLVCFFFVWVRVVEVVLEVILQDGRGDVGCGNEGFLRLRGRDCLVFFVVFRCDGWCRFAWGFCVW
jgi:hypothetical protein